MVTLKKKKKQDLSTGSVDIQVDCAIKTRGIANTSNASGLACRLHVCDY